MDIILDLPVPISVNRSRRVDWEGARKVKGWTRTADAMVLAARSRSCSPLKLEKIAKFELTVTLSEQHTGIDLDNGLKCLIDYLRRIELIEDDRQKCMRRLVVEWGSAPEGCRVTLRPLA